MEPTVNYVACIETSCMTSCSVYAKKPKSHYKAIIIIIVIIIIIIIIICIQHILVWLQLCIAFHKK